MKKILALLLALVLVIGIFAGCSPTDKKDDSSASIPSTGTGTGEGGNEGGGNTQTATSAKFGFSVKDPVKLIALISGGTPSEDAPEIKDFIMEFMSDAEGQNMLFTTGAKMFEKDYKLNTYLNTKGMVISAPGFTDTSYGATHEELQVIVKEFMEGFMEGITGGIAPEDPEMSGGSAMSVSAILALLRDNADDLAALLEKYVTLLMEELETNAAITETTEGGNVKMDITYTSDALATIATNVVEAFLTDADAIALLKTLGVDTDEMLSTKPSKEDLLKSAKENFAEMGVGLTAKVTTDAAKENILALDLDVLLNNVSIIILDYDQAAGSFSLVLQDDPEDKYKFTVNGTIKDGTTTIVVKNVSLVDNSYDAPYDATTDMTIVFSDGSFSLKSVDTDNIGVTTSEIKVSWSENGFSFYTLESLDTDSGYYDYETIQKIDVAWADTGITITMNMAGTEMIATITNTDGKLEGKLTVDGEDMGSITFDCVKEGNKTAYTLKSLVYDDFSIDFTDVGLSFFCETGITVPAAPTEYESLADMTEAELQAALEKIMNDNKELFEKLGLAGEAIPDVEANPM